MRAGQLRAHVERRYGLEQVAAAHAHVEGGHTRGKEVVAPMLAAAKTAHAEELVLRLATTTSTRDSGLLDAILPDFQEGLCQNSPDFGIVVGADGTDGNIGTAALCGTAGSCGTSGRKDRNTYRAG